jgi:glycosyltransferase involved in cell wall biosynthesis
MRPLRVAVLVDLAWRPNAGGHVKTWERLARAAASRPEAVELALHLTGEQPGAHQLADNVRLVLHRPVFTTARLPFLAHLPDHTDLAPYHRELARQLPGCDVVHTTDHFAFARTAARFGRRSGTPLVHSMHTDTAAYARVYTEEAVVRSVGRGRLGRLLLDRLGVAARAERRIGDGLARHLRRCTYVLVNRARDRRVAEAVVGCHRVGNLRRGIERDLFQPGRRDRAWLAAELGIPADRVVLLYVGRLDRCKNVELLTGAVGILLAQGRPVQLLCAGEGELRGSIERALGPCARCLGFVAPERLASLYASADLFVFPSHTEVSSNAVQEALCAGLPVVASATNAPVCPEAGLLVDGGVAAWADALDRLVTDPQRRAALAEAGVRWSRGAIPSWQQVLDEDLLPVWHRAARDAWDRAAMTARVGGPRPLPPGLVRC